MDRYKERIEKMIADLKDHPDIVVTEALFQPPATKMQIEESKILAGGKLPIAVESFYQEMNGFKLTWHHTCKEILEGDQRDYGYINLLPIEEVFGDWQDIVWFDSFAGGDRFRAVKPFDLFQPETCICFLKEENDVLQEQVAYHYLGEGLIKTGYNFADYIELLMESRGLWGWTKTLSQETCESEELERFQHKISILFPEVNIEIFKPKSI